MLELPDDLPECLIFLLGKAYQKAHSDFKKQLKPYGLTNLQHLVLEGLWYKEGLTASELGKALVLDKATVSGVLERMEEASWIIKRSDPDDRRAHRLYPSEKAMEMKDELIDIRRKSNDALVSGFSSEERILLKRLLRDLI